MHDLSAHVKFPDARFQSPLLIMSKIVAKILFFLPKNGKNALTFFFSNSDNDWKFWYGHFRNKARLATMFVITPHAQREQGKVI